VYDIRIEDSMQKVTQAYSAGSFGAGVTAYFALQELSATPQNFIGPYNSQADMQAEMRRYVQALRKPIPTTPGVPGVPIHQFWRHVMIARTPGAIHNFLMPLGINGNI